MQMVALGAMVLITLDVTLMAQAEQSPGNASSLAPTLASPLVDGLPDSAAFLLGSGLALLIALLAWGEQIRAITRDTRDLEREFLQSTHLSRAQLTALLRAQTPDDRLFALTGVMASGKLTSASQVEILPLFERWRTVGADLRLLQSLKYWLTILLTIVLFASGVASALWSTYLKLGTLLAPAGGLVVVLLGVIVRAGRVEQRLNDLLMQIGEKA